MIPLFRKLSLCVMLQISTAFLFAQHSWVLKKQKDGIRISVRQSDSSKLDDIKVEVELPGTIYQLADILIDVKRYPEWAYAIRSAQVVKKINAGNIIYYAQYSLPWPASDRDLYAQFSVSIDSAAKRLTVVSSAIKNYGPEKKDLVRIPKSVANWQIHALSDSSVKLTYVLLADPGGDVPGWVANIFASKAPLETFENLKNKMRLLNKH